MKTIETNEDWIQFQERCRWRYMTHFNKENNCSRGKSDSFSCAECYCPRILKEIKDIKQNCNGDICFHSDS